MSWVVWSRSVRAIILPHGLRKCLLPAGATRQPRPFHPTDCIFWGQSTKTAMACRPGRRLMIGCHDPTAAQASPRTPRRAAPDKFSPLGGHPSTGSGRTGSSDERGGHTPRRQAALRRGSPLGGQRLTRSEQRGGPLPHPNQDLRPDAGGRCRRCGGCWC